MASPLRFRGLTAVLSLLFSTVSGQASVSTILPAEAVVPSTPTILLDAETLQFTDAVFDRIVKDNVTSELANLFAFEANETFTKRQYSVCKTYPGDHLWPSEFVWGVFDFLLGNRLLATEPIASPCYDSKWGIKNLTECNVLVGRFTKATTQYVPELVRSNSWVGRYLTHVQ
jgi:hypothetical protein